MIDVQRTRVLIAAHTFQRAHLASDNRGQIDIFDIDGAADDLMRTLPGHLTS